MIPRSLALAILAGAGLAGAFGVALEVFNVGEQGYNFEGSAISVSTEHQRYKAGQDIHVTVKNSGILEIEFQENTYYGVRITQLDGIPVYLPEPTNDSMLLEVGQSIFFVWNQSKLDGQQVHNGAYRISAEGIDSEGNNVRGYTSIEISS